MRAFLTLLIWGIFALLYSVAPAHAQGQTIDQLNPGVAITGPEMFPMFQTQNPAVRTTATGLKTFTQSNAFAVATGPTFVNYFQPLQTNAILTMAHGANTLTNLPITTPGATGIIEFVQSAAGGDTISCGTGYINCPTLSGAQAASAVAVDPYIVNNAGKVVFLGVTEIYTGAP